MILKQHLAAMKDSDADAAAELIEREMQVMPLDSACGEGCKAIADATLAYCKAIESVCPFVSPEARWEVWSHAVRSMRVVYFG